MPSYFDFQVLDRRVEAGRKCPSFNWSSLSRSGHPSQFRAASPAFAKRQSNFTVSGDTPKTAAVSSTVRPAKKRRFTPCPRRASNLLRCSTASSSSTSWGDFDAFGNDLTETGVSIHSGDRGAARPLAKATRITRIAGVISVTRACFATGVFSGTPLTRYSCCR
jgi:hypothetical protein